MTRSIHFPPDDSRNQHRFDVLHSAMVIGGAQPATRGGGIEVLRREARILDLLDGVSLPNPAESAKLANGQPGRLVRAGTSIALEQPDFDLLKRRVIEDTPWLAQVARYVVDVADWLSAAPEDVKP